MKKHATTIVLVVIALALGFYLWRDRDRVTENERKRRENSVFVAWRREELTSIQIVREDETIVLERDTKAAAAGNEGKEGLWRMTSPRVERADPVAVDQLLGTLEFAAVARKVGDTSAPSSLGLESPRAHGEVRMGGLVTTFALGAESPRPEGSSYFRAGDGAPVVVTKELVTALLASSETYRDRTVVPYLATELARVELQGPPGRGGVVLERIDERSFRLEGGLLASRTGVDKLWAALAELRAEAFPKDADVDRLVAHPRANVRLVPKDTAKPPAAFWIGDACPGHDADVVVLRKAPTRAAACAPKDVLAALTVDASALVELHPFTLRMDEIEELRLERIAPPLTIEIARKGTGFHERAPVDRELTNAEADAANELVTSIANGEATSAGGGAGAPPFNVFARATIHAGETTQIVEVGPPRSDGSATLRRAIDDARLEAPASLVRKLVPRETTLRSRVVLDGDSRRVTRVTLRCGIDQELVDRGDGFRMTSPAGYVADGSIGQLVGAITKGHAEAWVADADAADATASALGFAKDPCRVVLGFEDGNAPVTLAFGPEGEGGVYARLDGAGTRGGVMVVPKAWRDMAGFLYVDRSALRVDASKIERVRVTKLGKPIVVDEGEARAAVAGLYADRALALHAAPRSPADLAIEIALAEGGPPKRITCSRGQNDAAPWTCATSGVDATFAIASSRLAPLIGAPDGGH